MVAYLDHLVHLELLQVVAFACFASIHYEDLNYTEEAASVACLLECSCDPFTFMHSGCFAYRNVHFLPRFKMGDGASLLHRRSFSLDADAVLRTNSSVGHLAGLKDARDWVDHLSLA